MKANLKNILGLVAGMTLLATTVPTWAGRVSTSSVIIHDNGVWSTATGNLVDARDSADNRQQNRVYSPHSQFVFVDHLFCHEQCRQNSCLWEW